MCEWTPGADVALEKYTPPRSPKTKPGPAEGVCPLRSASRRAGIQRRLLCSPLSAGAPCGSRIQHILATLGPGTSRDIQPVSSRVRLRGDADSPSLFPGPGPRIGTPTRPTCRQEDPSRDTPSPALDAPHKEAGRSSPMAQSGLAESAAPSRPSPPLAIECAERPTRGRCASVGTRGLGVDRTLRETGRCQERWRDRSARPAPSAPPRARGTAARLPRRATAAGPLPSYLRTSVHPHVGEAARTLSEGALPRETAAQRPLVAAVYGGSRRQATRGRPRPGTSLHAFCGGGYSPLTNNRRHCQQLDPSPAVMFSGRCVKRPCHPWQRGSGAHRRTAAERQGPHCPGADDEIGEALELPSGAAAVNIWNSRPLEDGDRPAHRSARGASEGEVAVADALRDLWEGGGDPGRQHRGPGLDEYTALRGPGTGWDLHEHRRSSPTHL